MKRRHDHALTLASLLLLTVSKWGLLSLVTADSVSPTGVNNHRALQQTNGTTTSSIFSLSTTVKPVTPSPQQPGETMPPELTNIPPLAAETVTVTLKIPGTTAEGFRQYYQKTVAAVAGSLTGTPADLWQFSNIGTTAAESPASSNKGGPTTHDNNSNNSTARSNTGSSNKNSRANSLTGSTTTADGGDNLDRNSHCDECEHDSSRGLLQHPDFPDGQDQSEAKPLRLHRRLLQEQAYEVSLSLLTLSPQLVVYRLTQANAAAASLSSGCKTEFCVRLKTSNVPIDGTNIHVTPDMAALTSKYGTGETPAAAVAETKGEDPAERQRVSTILAAIICSVGGVLLIVAVTVIYVKLKRSYAQRHAAAGVIRKSDSNSKGQESKSVTPRGNLTPKGHGKGAPFSGSATPISKQSLQGSTQIQTVHSVLAAQTATAIRAEVNAAPSLTITTTNSGESGAAYHDSAGASPLSPLNAETLKSLDDSSTAHNNRAAVAARLVPWVTDLPVQTDHPDPNVSDSALGWNRDLETGKLDDDDISESSFVIERGHHSSSGHRRSASRDFDEETRAHADLTVRINRTSSSVASPTSNVLRMNSRSSVPGSALNSHPVPGFTTPPRYPGSAYSRRQSSYGSLVSTPALSQHDSLMGMIDPKALHDALHQCYVSLQQVHELITPAGTPGQSPGQTPKPTSRTSSFNNVLDPRHFNSYNLP